MRKGAGRRDPAQALFEDANRHVRAGRNARARQLARQGMQMFPGLAAFWGLAGALALLDRDWVTAESDLARARAMMPHDPYLTANYAAAKAGSNDFAGAIPLFREALARLPDETKFRAGLADSLARAGRFEEAEKLYEHPCVGEPVDVQGRADLAFALIEAGRGERARALIEAIPETHRNDELLRVLALAAGDACEIELNLEILRRPLVDGARPSIVRESAALFAAHYDDSETDDSLFARHVAWGERFAPPPRRPKPPRARARIAFVSPDLKSHSVASFFLAYLNGRERSKTEIVCISDVGTPDKVTARIRAMSDRWHDVFGRDDTKVVETIRAEAPDVLVDLAGHTGSNRLSALATRPADLQATWLGYPDTTGLPAIDLRLIDSITDPPGVGDRLATEKLVRIEGCFLCYAPHHDRPTATARPDGPPVFGSFNALPKMGPKTVALWARVLHAAQDARLLLKTKILGRADVRAKVEAAFAAHGIGPERLILLGAIESVGGHLGAYGLMDVALDPLLYNGTTTTCEALSMGVPVVTLPGTRHAARVGASLLTAAGAIEGLATSADDYVARAVELARDRTRDRMAARARFESSALCDAPDFARRFEAALRSAFT